MPGDRAQAAAGHSLPDDSSSLGVCALTHVALRESHLCLVQFVCSPSFSAQPYEQLVRSPCLRLNPLYWALFLATFPFMLLGMAFHTLLGQGPHHVDEHSTHGYRMPDDPSQYVDLDTQVRRVRSLENEIRSHWIYLTNAFYLIQFVGGWVTIITRLANLDTRRWDSTMLHAVVDDVCIVALLVASNVLLLDAVHRRRLWLTRYYIILNATYALTEIVDFCFGVYIAARADEASRHAGTIASYGFDVAMFVLGAAVYARLWLAYEDSGPGGLEMRRSADPGAETENRAVQTLRVVRMPSGPRGKSEPWPLWAVIATFSTCVFLWVGEFVWLALDLGYGDIFVHETLT